MRIEIEVKTLTYTLLLISATLPFLYVLPFLSSSLQPLSDDFQTHFFKYLLLKRSLEKYGEIPNFNPFWYGGALFFPNLAYFFPLIFSYILPEVTSFLLTEATFVALSSLLIFLVCKQIGVDEKYSILASLFSSASFPMYENFILHHRFPETIAIFSFLALVYLMLSRKRARILIASFLFLSLASPEIFIISLIFFFVQAFLRRNRKTLQTLLLFLLISTPFLIKLNNYFKLANPFIPCSISGECQLMQIILLSSNSIILFPALLFSLTFFKKRRLLFCFSLLLFFFVVIFSNPGAVERFFLSKFTIPLIALSLLFFAIEFKKIRKVPGEVKELSFIIFLLFLFSLGRYSPLFLLIPNHQFLDPFKFLVATSYISIPFLFKFVEGDKKMLFILFLLSLLCVSSLPRLQMGLKVPEIELKGPGFVKNVGCNIPSATYLLNNLTSLEGFDERDRILKQEIEAKWLFVCTPAYQIPKNFRLVDVVRGIRIYENLEEFKFSNSSNVEIRRLSFNKFLITSNASKTQAVKVKLPYSKAWRVESAAIREEDGMIVLIIGENRNLTLEFVY